MTSKVERRSALRVPLFAVAVAFALPACGPTQAARGPAPGDADASILPGDDPDVDHDFDGFTARQGDCDDRDPAVHPGAPELCNSRDDDCDGRIDETCDWDGDGYTPDTGDCRDDERLVNPGAYEVPGNDIDDNCDGRVDEPVAPCEVDSGRDGASLAAALELCPPFLTAASVGAASDLRSRGVFRGYGVIMPRAGGRFAVLATGIAADEKDAAFALPQDGTAFANDAANPLPMAQHNNVCGRSYEDQVTVHDDVELTLTLHVPTNASSFSFDFFFLTAEYPEWVGESYNDKFLALLDSRSYRGNVSFDRLGDPITVNVGFLSLCDSALICHGTRRNACPGNSLGQLAGTGYELAGEDGAPLGGGTGWLTTTAPVTPGETATLRFVLFDEGDHLLDSAVLLDNFRWKLESASGPATIQ